MINFIIENKFLKCKIVINVSITLFRCHIKKVLINKNIINILYTENKLRRFNETIYMRIIEYLHIGSEKKKKKKNIKK